MMTKTITNASYDDDANANGGDEYYRDVELNVHLLSPNNHHLHRQRYYDDEYNTKNNYRGGVIIQEHTNTVCVPVYAKPPLAFLLGMFCAMPIALWEAKRKVRLDSRIYGGLDSSLSLSSAPALSGGKLRGALIRPRRLLLLQLLQLLQLLLRRRDQASAL